MGLKDNLNTEFVERLALRKPVTVTPETPLREVIQKMREGRLGCAIVIDAETKPVGMFTESMLTQLLAHRTTFLDEPVSNRMAEKWPWVKLNDSIADVLSAMELKNIRFICVVDDDGRLAGLTGQKGLMEYISDHFPGQVMVQRIGNAPFMQTREGA